MTILKHTTPCKQCPFRRAALPGYLGNSTTDEFLGQTMLAEHRMPCHMAINYEKKDWEEKQLPTAAHCAGALIFMKNQFKRPRDKEHAAMLEQVETDTETVFQWSQEFRDHHNQSVADFVKKRRANEKS